MNVLYIFDKSILQVYKKKELTNVENLEQTAPLIYQFYSVLK